MSFLWGSFLALIAVRFTFGFGGTFCMVRGADSSIGVAAYVDHVVGCQ